MKLPQISQLSNFLTNRIRRPLTRFFWSSLLVRVVVSTFITCSILVSLISLFLIHQVSKGILEARKDAVVSQANSALEAMQQKIANTDLRNASLYELINQISYDSAASSDNYYLMVDGPAALVVSPEILPASVPDSLRETVENSPGMYVTETLVQYRPDRNKESIPGYVVGGSLRAWGKDVSISVYFIFPNITEVKTINIVKNTVISTSILLVLLLVKVATLLSHQTTKPIRRASKVATKLAEGDLGYRMQTKGSDEMVKLSKSMNYMADEIQNQIKQLEQLSTLQQRFVSDVSHELRTPLTTVKMASDLLYETKDDLEPYYTRSIELMHDEIERFENLLADLLEISRYDSGAAKLSIEHCDLVIEVLSEVESVNMLADKMGCAIYVYSVDSAFVDVDINRVKRIVRNLLSNAIEHGQSKPIVVQIGANETAVAVKITDHGIGFDQEQAEKMFERFWRADPSRKRTLGGTGLGLSIALEDAHLHSGTLQAWGKPGVGACFRLTIPRRPGGQISQSPLPEGYNGGVV